MIMSLISKANNILHIAEKYRFYAGIFNLTVGLIGNISIILVLMNVKLFRGNQCSFYLIIESISNIGLLITIYPSRILDNILGYDLVLASLPWCKIRSMFAQIFGLWSLFTICCMAFDQYLSTNNRYSFRQRSTLKLAKYLTIFNIWFSTLQGIICLIFIEIQSSLGCSMYHLILKKYYSFFYYPILSSTLPVTITITFSFLAYHNVRKIIRRQISIIRRRLDRQLTAMVLARVISLIILGLPFICISLYELNLNNNEDDYMKLTISALVSVICYALLYTNFSINFYLFLAISSRFRRQVKHFFFKQCWHSLKLRCIIKRRNININRINPQTTPGTVSIVESV